MDMTPNQCDGPVYFHRRTKQLVQWIPQGALALLEHEDIDEMAAQSLIEKKVKAVLNFASSMSGKYVSKGTMRLVMEGIPVYDINQPERVKSVLRQGQRLRIKGNEVWLIEKRPLFLSSLVRYTPRHIQRKLGEAESNLTRCLQSFVQNTLSHASRELPEILKPIPIPELKVSLRGQAVVVVTRGSGYREDLEALQPYIQRMKPVLIGVDGGAEAIMDCGLEPDIILGDMDSVTPQALFSGAELVVHAYRDGRAPGLELIRRLGLSAHLFSCFGTSEDAAQILAYEAGAEHIIMVGSHTHMLDFLEKGRQGMASTLLVRMKLGDKLIDVKGLHRLGSLDPDRSFTATVPSLLNPLS